LWEAFLLQMNDFDRYLEAELKVWLDPVAARRPPFRKRRSESAVVSQPSLAVEALAAEAIPVVEPVVVVTLPVASASTL